MKTTAAILTKLHRDLEIAEIEIPPLKAGQVLVSIKATSICGSQINEIDGRKGRDPYLPHLLGHEAGGVVEALGKGVGSVKVGDRVVAHWRKSAGCDAEAPVYLWNGRRVNAGRVTTFQEKSVISENRLTVVPKSVPFEVAALYGCCITTGFGAVERDANLKKGEACLVLGTGGVGLVEIAAAKLRGASVIIAADIHEKKLELAKRFGATGVVHAGKRDLKKAVLGLMKERPVDVVFENTGLQKLIELGYELCGPRGRMILVGVPDVSQKARIDTLPLHFGKILTGSFGGSAEPDKDIPRILRLERRGFFRPALLIRECFRLDQINQAIRAMREGRALRPVIRFD